MSSLNNLYISQSYQGLLHFGTNTGSVATLGLIEDGLGNSLGLYLNNSGDLKTTTSISSSTIEAQNLIVKNKIELSGSIDIDGPVTASAAFIESDLIVSGTLYAKEVHTLIESSSIIFSTGSNILGDSVNDTQTLNGKVIVSGSEEITGSLFVRNDISSSTLNGIGNVTLYSQSVDARLDIVEATASLYVPFSQSVDSRLDYLEATSSFLTGPFSQSVDQRLDSLEAATASLGYVTTGSYNPFTQSVNTRLNALEISTASLNLFTQSANSRLNNLESTSASTNISIAELNNWSASAKVSITNINSTTASLNTSVSNLNSFSSSTLISLSNLNSNSASVNISISNLNSTTASLNSAVSNLISKTGSYATTGSNTFIGNQIITGSLILSSSAAVELTTIGNSLFSGSVRGQVFPITIASNTASMDCSLGNFFTLTLPAGATRLVATNIQPGETLSLRILNSTSASQCTGSTSVKFPNGFTYVPTNVSGSTDIITFLTFDTGSIYAVAANYFV